MYIKSAQIQNIRSITDLFLEFEEGQEQGWHVIIGDNGSGKTTVARALALGLLGGKDEDQLGFNFFSWIGQEKTQSDLIVNVRYDLSYDMEPDKSYFLDLQLFFDGLIFKHHRKSSPADSLVEGLEAHEVKPNHIYSRRKWSWENGFVRSHYDPTVKNVVVPSWDTLLYPALLTLILNILPQSGSGWFSCSFGPFRRFKGGNQSVDNIYNSYPRAGAHLSLFRDDTALTEIEAWINKIYTQELEKKNRHLHFLRLFLNGSPENQDDRLLPNGVSLEKVTSDGIFFTNSEGLPINLHDLSDGYRSVLSLTFELIRQLIRSYGEEKVFHNISEGRLVIDLPGVVIIDEVDAHLHPTWQTRIGQWFTKYFPKLQFIVTTHSPLICRACGEHGKIFHLSTTDSGTQGKELKGLDRDRLVYGDILEAYETDAFGDGVEWSEEGKQLQKEYRDLVYKKRYGADMSVEEIERLAYLKQIFHANVEAR